MDGPFTQQLAVKHSSDVVMDGPLGRKITATKYYIFVAISKMRGQLKWVTPYVPTQTLEG